MNVFEEQADNVVRFIHMADGTKEDYDLLDQIGCSKHWMA